MTEHTIRVLLVEDNPTDALLVREEMGGSSEVQFDVLHFEQLHDALRALATQSFDVALLDLSLPDSEGFDTFVKLHAAAPDLPIILLTGYTDEILATKAVQAGAQDYILKGRIGDDVLKRSIKYAIERKRTERKLMESEERYRSLVESSPDAIFVRCEEKFVFANTAALKLLGAESLSQLQIFTLEELVHPESLEIFRNASRTIDSFIAELRFIRLDGTEIVTEATGVAYSFDGNPAIQVLARDVTERNKLQQQFLRAQRMESIGTLASGIAHDLNNILSPILMVTGVLRLQETDSKRRKILETLESCAKRGSDMVRQVLSFGRGLEGIRTDVNVGRLLEDMERMLQQTFDKQIKVQKTVAPDLWTVTGDRTQLHQVLLNLCVNARDAMPHGGKLMLGAENFCIDEQYAGLEGEMRAGAYVLISVEDTGDGIPPQVIEKIFDPFFTTKEIGKGTGLGLSTTLGIVKSHGGTVKLTSEVGQGTKFQVYLPAQTNEATTNTVGPVPVLPRGNGEWVLIIDDEAAVRQITKHTLESFGYRVLLAADGIEGVAVYAQNAQMISLVVTDMMMPNMSGPATIQILKSMNPQLPILGASGILSDAHISRCAALGVNKFLSKPYSADDMLKALHEVLQSSAQKNCRLPVVGMS